MNLISTLYQLKFFSIIQKTNTIHPKLNIYNPSNNETNFQFSIISSEYRKELYINYTKTDIKKKKISLIQWKLEIEFEIDREIRKGKRDFRGKFDQQFPSVRFKNCTI